MKDARNPARDAQTPRPRPKTGPARTRQGGGGLPLAGALALTVVCSGAAWWTGDRMGFQRGAAGGLACKDAELLDRLDAQARRHQDRLAARSAEPVATNVNAPSSPLPQRGDRVTHTAVGAVRKPEPADNFSFHDALRGAPGRSVDRGPTLVSAAPMVRPPAMVVNIPPPAALARPAAPAAPAEAPVVSGSALAAPVPGDFTLQTGAFPDKAEALKVVDGLRAKGYRPVLVPSENNGVTFYRVRLGRFPDRAAAEAGAAAVQRATNAHPLILKH